MAKTGPGRVSSLWGRPEARLWPSPGGRSTFGHMDKTQLSVHINADAEQVWRMLREPARIAQWHGWEMDGLEDEIQQIYYRDVVGKSPTICSLDLGMGDVFTLEPVADGTLLTMTRGPGHRRMGKVRRRHHRGLVHLHPAAQVRAGTASALAPAHRLCGRHRRRHRAPRLWDALGIDTGWLPDPGEEYKLTALPPGPRLEGKVWYRTDTQLGLTVADYAEHGDGLLILAQQAPAGGHPRTSRRPGHRLHLRAGRRGDRSHRRPVGYLHGDPLPRRIAAPQALTTAPGPPSRPVATGAPGWASAVAFQTELNYGIGVYRHGLGRNLDDLRVVLVRAVVGGLR